MAVGQELFTGFLENYRDLLKDLGLLVGCPWGSVETMWPLFSGLRPGSQVSGLGSLSVA